MISRLLVVHPDSRNRRRCGDADGLPLRQARVGESLQHSGEDRFVRLEIDQALRARNRRMIGRASGSTKPRHSRRANESTARHSIARSSSNPSK
jgi:hypothetical protein